MKTRVSLKHFANDCGFEDSLYAEVWVSFHKTFYKNNILFKSLTIILEASVSFRSWNFELLFSRKPLDDCCCVISDFCSTCLYFAIKTEIYSIFSFCN